jgi:hypothetical protein
MNDLENMICCLMEVVCNIGTDTATCGFCGKKYGEAVPDGKVPDESVSVGELDGVTVVYTCRCERIQQYARFLIRHRFDLPGILRKFALIQQENARFLKQKVDEAESVDSPPMLAVGNDELGGPVGEEIVCRICGGRHPVEYGEKVLDDGTKVPSKLLAFFKCGGKAYLCGIDGRSWAPPSGRKGSEEGNWRDRWVTDLAPHYRKREGGPS